MKALRSLIGLVGLVAALVLLYLLSSRRPAPAPPAARAPAALPRRKATPPIPLPAAEVRVIEGGETGEGGVLSGEVRSSRSAALIPGAQLTLLAGGAALAVAAPEGRFRFAAPAPGDYALLGVEARGFRPFAPASGESPVVFHARRGAALSDLTLWLDPAEPCLVRVLDAAGRPVAGAAVELRLGAGAASPAPATTSAEGEAELAAAPDDLVEARAPGLRPARERLGPGCAATLRLQPLPDGGLRESAIAGRVLDAAGQPVGGALVHAQRAGDDPRTAIARRALGVEAEARSDAEGRFRLALGALDDGKGAGPSAAPAAAGDDAWDLEASAPEHGDGRARARGGDSGVLITLPAPAHLRGVVRTPEGRPASAFAVFCAEAIGALERGAARSRTVLDSEGRFSLALAPGSYHVSAAARGYAPAREQRVQLGPGGAEVVLTLGRGARIRGQVTDERSGRPLPGARAALEGVEDGGDTPLPTSAAATAGQDGRFELGGAPAGLRSLLVTAEGHHGRSLSGVRVEEGRDVEVAVALRPTEPGEAPSIDFVGIGCVLGPKGDVVLIGECFPGGGGAQAGLQPGDELLRVDGEDVAALGFPDAVQRIRGPEGSVVLLAWRRGAAVQEARITRTRIRPPQQQPAPQK